MPRIITITSGKGGVGKTNISLNVALYLASEGHRTCLFDADLGLANINILLGLQPEYTLKDLILDGRTIDDIIIRDYKGIDILPGSSGVEQVANLDPSRTQELIGALSQLEDYDFLLFDTSAGISKNVISFCLATLELVVIITPEPTSLTDAYSLVKVLSMNGYQGKLQVVVNQCKDFSAAKSVYNKFRGAIQKYLGMQVYALGVVFEDPKVVEAVKQQEPLLIRYPGSLASQCIRKIGQKLLDGTDEELSSVQVEGFWKRWLGVIQGPLKLKETGQKPSKESEENNEQGTVVPETRAPVSKDDNVGRSEEREGRGHEKRDKIQDDVVGKLADGLASLAEELRLIRNALEKNGRPSRDLQRVGGESFSSPQGPKIKLDLEAFLRRKIAKQGNEVQ